jgi:hypothetical protein
LVPSIAGLQIVIPENATFIEAEEIHERSYNGIVFVAVRDERIVSPEPEHG